MRVRVIVDGAENKAGQAVPEPLLPKDPTPHRFFPTASRMREENDFAQNRFFCSPSRRPLRSWGTRNLHDVHDAKKSAFAGLRR